MANPYQGDSTKQKLSGGPKSMTNSRFSGGKFSSGATSASMSNTPVPLQYDKVVKGGKIQYTSTCIEGMNRTPNKGWDSHATPLSTRAEFQSKGGGR